MLGYKGLRPFLHQEVRLNRAVLIKAALSLAALARPSAGMWSTVILLKSFQYMHMIRSVIAGRMHKSVLVPLGLAFDPLSQPPSTGEPQKLLISATCFHRHTCLFPTGNLFEETNLGGPNCPARSHPGS